MPLNPPPTIEANLLLVKQTLLRNDMARAAEVEYALRCADSTLATYQDAIDDFQVNFVNTLGNLFDNEVIIPAPTGRGGDGSDVPLLVIGSAAPGAGIVVETSLPPNCAALFRKRTSLGGRSNRGRTYLPFCLSEAQVNETGGLSAGEIAAFQGQANSFLAQLVTDSTPMVIENKTFSSPVPPRHVTHIAGSAVTVTAYTVEGVIATQRRRLGR